MSNSSWCFVESEDKLSQLKGLTSWSIENSRTVEIFASRKHRDIYPNDISRSGHATLNYHVLVEFVDKYLNEEPSFIEFAFIACAFINTKFLNSPHFNNVRLDSLSRCKADTEEGFEMKCACLMYRIIDEEQMNLHDYSYFEDLYPASNSEEDFSTS